MTSLLDKLLRMNSLDEKLDALSGLKAQEDNATVECQKSAIQAIRYATDHVVEESLLRQLNIAANNLPDFSLFIQRSLIYIEHVKQVKQVKQVTHVNTHDQDCFKKLRASNIELEQCQTDYRHALMHVILDVLNAPQENYLLSLAGIVHRDHPYYQPVMTMYALYAKSK